MNNVEKIKALLDSPAIERLIGIANKIVTQDNRHTDQPIFIVQRKNRIYGFDEDYADGYDWVCPEADYDVACDRLHDILDRRKNQYRSTFGYEQHWHQDEWQFVTACFTEQGCKDYLARDGHNIRSETRIYADGSYRNNEFRDVRDFLIKIALLSKAES